MFIQTFFIYDFTDRADNRDIRLPGNSCLIYPLGLNDQGGGLYNKVFTGNQEISFSLLLDLESLSSYMPTWDGFIDSVISFTQHYKYFNLAYKTPLIFLKNAGEGERHFITTLGDKFREQGYPGLDYVHISRDHAFIGSNTGRNWLSIAGAKESAAFLPDYEKILRTSYSPDMSLILPAYTYRDLEDLITGIAAAEDRLFREAPYMHFLLATIRQYQVQNGDAQIGNERLQETIDSLKSYYSFYNDPEAGYKKQISEIVNFYKYEYEILPLWYKRFGHVVKVLMGRRTFKSLFNDNVKKYKD